MSIELDPTAAAAPERCSTAITHIVRPGTVARVDTGPFVVSFVGPSGVGKTTLIERLIPCLRERGLRVGTVKHAPHGHDVVDKAGSDSSRHRSAGADAVLLAGASGAVLFLAPDTDALRPCGRHHTPTDGHEQLARLGALVTTHLAHVDVVLAEGFAAIHDALITVHRAAVAPKRPAKPDHAPTVWFAVTDEPTGTDVGFDDLDALAERIAHRANAARVPPAQT